MLRKSNVNSSSSESELNSSLSTSKLNGSLSDSELRLISTRVLNSTAQLNHSLSGSSRSSIANSLNSNSSNDYTQRLQDNESTSEVVAEIIKSLTRRMNHPKFNLQQCEEYLTRLNQYIGAIENTDKELSTSIQEVGRNNYLQLLLLKEELIKKYKSMLPQIGHQKDEKSGVFFNYLMEDVTLHKLRNEAVDLIAQSFSQYKKQKFDELKKQLNCLTLSDLDYSSKLERIERNSQKTESAIFMDWIFDMKNLMSDKAFSECYQTIYNAIENKKDEKSIGSKITEVLNTYFVNYLKADWENLISMLKPSIRPEKSDSVINLRKIPQVLNPHTPGSPKTNNLVKFGLHNSANKTKSSGTHSDPDSSLTPTYRQ